MQLYFLSPQANLTFSAPPFSSQTAFLLRPHGDLGGCFGKKMETKILKTLRVPFPPPSPTPPCSGANHYRGNRSLSLNRKHPRVYYAQRDTHLMLNQATPFWEGQWLGDIHSTSHYQGPTNSQPPLCEEVDAMENDAVLAHNASNSQNA